MKSSYTVGDRVICKYPKAGYYIGVIVKIRDYIYVDFLDGDKHKYSLSSKLLIGRTKSNKASEIKEAELSTLLVTVNPINPINYSKLKIEYKVFDPNDFNIKVTDDIDFENRLALIGTKFQRAYEKRKPKNSVKSINNDDICMGAFYKKTLVGFILIRVSIPAVSKEYNDISWIEVAEDYRNKSIFRGLLDHAFKTYVESVGKTGFNQHIDANIITNKHLTSIYKEMGIKYGLIVHE